MGEYVEIPLDLLRRVLEALLGDPTQGHCTALARELENHVHE